MNSAPMKAFYDKMVVDKMNALAKKFGGKVEESNLGETNPKGWHITPPDQTVSGKWMVKSNEYNSKGFHFDTEAEAKANLEQQIAGERTPKQPIHVLRITPQLRDAALSKGFSLFADTGKVGAPLAALSRVEHNPFTEQRAYHGTKTPGFDKFKKPDEDYMIDRMLGTHVAKDPEIANTFTGKSEFSFGRKVEGAAGGVYPVTIPHDAKFLNADPVKGAFDQTKIERMVMKTAFEKDPELLARYLEDARAVPKEDAVKLANDMVAGKKVTLPTDGPDYDLDRFISNFGGKPYRVADRAKAVEIFKKDAQDNGYAGIKYTNTSPGETANAKDKTSYIIFDTSKHLRNALTGQLMSDTSANAPLSALAKQHGVKLTPVESNPFTTDAYHGTRGFRGTEVEPKSGYAIHRDGYEFSVWDTTNRRTISPKFKSEAEANAWIDKRVGSELFSTSNPELADDYALGSQIMPLKLNTKDYHVFDAKGSNWQYANKHAIFEAEQLGKKGVVLKNVIDNNGVDRGPQTVYITLDPSTVRSKFAKFDPAKYGESGLLKASGLPIHQDKDGNQLMPIFTKEQYESMTHQPVKPGADVGSLKAVAVGAGKAAEWLAFLGSRNYPHINGPLTAAWIAQWPMMERMLKEDINKQLKAGKKPSEIEFSEGSIGDMFGIISSLRKKFGNDANRLTPVAHDPFNSR
jgi:hypothetical protein